MDKRWKLLPDADKAVIHLQNVSKTYAVGEVKVSALSEVSLDIQKGEFVVILGPSGCGKSTLMNLIGGLDRPTDGEVVINGQNISHFDERQMTRFRRDAVGFIFQFFNLVNTLTAEENVQLVADLSTNPLNVGEVLEAVGLGERRAHFPAELSGGEQQRVAIARALVKCAPIMLCDEPTGELDEETGRRILDLLHATTHERGQTVLLVTHNAAISQIADRTVRLRSGKIVSDEINASPIPPSEVHW
ncbi:MAG: ABC transporter ATP-binding protein [Armatimonadetes bacterium]|nr:ABC transporter ATP-binding protein [Armatimonadota bacterium]